MLTRSCRFLLFLATALAAGGTPQPGDAIDIGSNRELFVDGLLVDRLGGRAELRLHHPVPQELSLVLDNPWEGNGSGGYKSIFQDGDRYRMYYTASQIDPVQDAHPGEQPPPRPEFTCYAESRDGIHWLKPKLGLHEFRGSRANNIVFASELVGSLRANAAHTAVFLDDNPQAKTEGRYKAFRRSDTRAKRGLPVGLLAYQSPDGLHWTLMSSQPVITDGAFDSQNLAFWDAARGEYRAYWRYDTGGVTNGTVWKPSGYRAIRTAASKDFIHWGKPANLRYDGSTDVHLYISQVKPYYRAPQLLIGFPVRYVERPWSDSTDALPQLKDRQIRGRASKRFGTALTESLLMASRDGVNFKRWEEAFLRPGVERPGTWAYGDQYIGWQLVETKSALAGAPPELSLYASESYWIGTASAIRRYTLRLDGFVSVEAPMTGGELVTKPLRFLGGKLSLNFSTSAAGGVRVEIQDAHGIPLPGFALADCSALYGDSVARTVSWKKGGDLAALEDRPVRLRFVLEDADLYAFQFRE